MPHIPSDAAKRFADNVNGLLSFHKGWEIKDKYLAISLADGGYDGNMYDTKRDAVSHQSLPKNFAYFCFRNCLGGISYFEAEKFLLVFRTASENNKVDFVDPDDARGGPDLIMTNKANDLYSNFMRHAMTNQGRN